MTIQSALHAMARGELSSVELVRRSLDRIRVLNGPLNAFITITADSALAQAAQADHRRHSGAPCGPLCGIPVALKDVFCTKGVRTTAGSRLFENNVPDFDSAVAEKLASAGAILIGKTGLHELAYGITSQNPHFGPIRNPRNIDAIPGGSSGGSGAAVASGMVPMAMGTDTGGSIRIPAAFCGCVGLKPTSGRISRFGVLPLDFSLDHMGPLTTCVRDAALVLNVLAGHDERDDTSSRHPVPGSVPGSVPNDPSFRNKRIGVPETFFFERLHPEVDTTIRHALKTAESLGAELVPVTLPDVPSLNVIGRLILMCEASAVYGREVESRPEAFGPDLLLLLQQGRLLPATTYINAQRLRRQFQRDYAPIWGQVDCLVTPSAPITAPRIGQATVSIDGEEEDTRMASTRFARVFNVLGWPAISIPAGQDAQGMPIGLQFVSRPFSEPALLETAAAFEAYLPPIKSALSKSSP